MKLGAIVWGLPDHFNIDIHNKLGAILKPFTQTQLAKFGIEKGDTLWIGSCFDTTLIPMGERESKIDMQDTGNGKNAIGSKDPRDYISVFKALGYTHLLLIKMPFLVGNYMLAGKQVSEDALNNLILLMTSKEDIHFIAQPNYDTDESDDWDIMPIIVDINTANPEFMLYNKPLANVHEDNIKSYDFTSIGLYAGNMSWVDEVGSEAFLRVLESTIPADVDIQLLTSDKMGPENPHHIDVIEGMLEEIKDTANA